LEKANGLSSDLVLSDL